MGKSIDAFGAPPVVFADQPVHLAIGPFTSKLTLAMVENDGTEPPRPVLTLAMPTPMLFQMARDILEQASSDAVKRSTVKALLDAARSIENETSVEASSGDTEMTPEPRPRKRMTRS